MVELTKVLKTTYLKNKQFLTELDKKLVFQTDKAKESLLDENNLSRLIFPYIFITKITILNANKTF